MEDNEKYGCAACNAEIASRQGEAVGARDGRVWIVCRDCSNEGVHVGDVEHARPVIDPRAMA